MKYEFAKTTFDEYPDDFLNGVFLDPTSSRRAAKKFKRQGEEEDDDTFLLQYIDPKYFA